MLLSVEPGRRMCASVYGNYTRANGLFCLPAREGINLYTIFFLQQLNGKYLAICAVKIYCFFSFSSSFLLPPAAASRWPSSMCVCLYEST